MYTENDLVRVAKRENNAKRSYLVVNRLQGKHIPVRASEAFQMFGELAEQVAAHYAAEKILVIGFAETATAIGATVARRCGAPYLQTTRETVNGAQYLFFSEEHSHATEQRLVRDELDALDKSREMPERIVFVEDEVTTGNTILNIIRILEQTYPSIQKYAVASLLNGMEEEAAAEYDRRGIALHYLVKTNHASYAGRVEKVLEDGRYIKCSGDAESSGVVGDSKGSEDIESSGVVGDSKGSEDIESSGVVGDSKDSGDNEGSGAAGNQKSKENGETCNAERSEMRVIEMAIPSALNTRRLTRMEEYDAQIEKLWEVLREETELCRFHSVLVLGTEEFMYPALRIAEHMEEAVEKVRCHSTTRSPIAVSAEEDYPLHIRYELRSLYDEERRTFLYDLEKYDCVFVLTDAPGIETAGWASLWEALKQSGNNMVYRIRWC